MTNYKELIKKLNNKYGNKIKIGERNKNYTNQKNFKESLNNIEYTPYSNTTPQEDIIIYINENINYEIAVIWNNITRKNKGEPIKTFSVNKHTWNNLFEKDEVINSDYIRDNKNIYHKVIFIKVEALEYYINDIYTLIEPSDDDKGFPKELSNDENYNSKRKRTTCTRASRDYKFRERVLERYGNRCAICRCNEKKLLQAAHIEAVKDDGTDDPNNGICLCANHHLMLDNQLIKIEGLEIVNISDSVKSMSWYEEFINKYDSKLLEGKIWNKFC